MEEHPFKAVYEISITRYQGHTTGLHFLSIEMVLNFLNYKQTQSKFIFKRLSYAEFKSGSTYKTSCICHIKC